MTLTRTLTPRRLLAALAVCAGTLALPAVSPAGAQPTRGDHCVLTVIGQRRSGEYITTTACYDTFPDAMASVGITTNAKHPRDFHYSPMSGDPTIIAIHYDYFGLSGPSVSVAGTTCSGGYVNLPTVWRNRVSSTYTAVCSTIVHFDGLNKTGASEALYQSGNLDLLNNKADSIQYL